MDLIVHSLYSHKEVFLRQLVSNASCALDKLRFLSVTDPSVLADGGEMEIRIKPDPDAGTITITDSGIGMTKDELKDCPGTIAQSLCFMVTLFHSLLMMMSICFFFFRRTKSLVQIMDL